MKWSFGQLNIRNGAKKLNVKNIESVYIHKLNISVGNEFNEK